MSITHKRCPDCEETKEAKEFYKYKNRLYTYCRKCCYIREVKWKQDNPDKVRAKGKRYREKHRDQKKQRDKEYHARNREKSLAQQAAYREKNRDSLRAQARTYYHEHKKQRQEYNERHRKTERYRAQEQSRKNRRRANEISSGSNFTAGEWMDLCKRYDNICLACGKKKKLSADHVIPLALGGSNDIKNIQPLCKPCNSRKYLGTTDYRKEVGEENLSGQTPLDKL